MMIPGAATTNAWADVWSAQMFAILWQSALLAGIVGLLASLLRRASPALRYWLWQLVALKLLLMPLWSVSFSLAWLPAPVEEVRPADHRPSIAETPPSITETIPPDEQVAPSPPNSQQAVANESIAFASTEAQAPGPLRPHLSWTAWLMLVWAMAVVAQFAMLLGHLARLRYLLKHASPAGSALESLVRDCAARVKLTRIPRVLTVDKDCSPFVSGIWRTVIVLPRCMEALLADGLLEPVIVHELAHVTRLDLLWNWIPQLARIFYFFNPVVYWVAFRVRLEGELACDGWAMAATGKAAGDYADLLVRVVSQLSEPAILRSGSAASAGFDGQGNVNRNE